MVFVLLTGHAIFGILHLGAESSQWNARNVIGALSYVGLLVLTVSSVAPLRVRSYQWFRGLHVGGALVFLVGALVHTSETKSVLYFVLPATLCMVADRAWIMYCLYGRRRLSQWRRRQNKEGGDDEQSEYRVLEVVPLPEGVTRFEVEAPRGVTLEPGQWIHVHLPNLYQLTVFENDVRAHRPFRMHPYWISTILPNAQSSRHKDDHPPAAVGAVDAAAGDKGGAADGGASSGNDKNGNGGVGGQRFTFHVRTQGVFSAEVYKVAQLHAQGKLQSGALDFRALGPFGRSVRSVGVVEEVAPLAEQPVIIMCSEGMGISWNLCHLHRLVEQMERTPHLVRTQTIYFIWCISFEDQYEW